MKTQYQRLNKENKKKAKKAYFATSGGMYVKRKLTSSFICAILSVAFGIYLIVEAAIKEYSTWQYIYGTLIILFGIFFVIAYFVVINKKVNNYIIKNKMKF